MLFAKKDYSQKTLMVIKEKCPQNHKCPSVHYCPSGAIKQKGFSAPIIDKKLCTKCGRCLKTCPHGVFQFV